MEESTVSEKPRGTVEHIVRQEFGDFFRSETSIGQFDRENIREDRKLQIDSYENTLREIKNAEDKIHKVEILQTERIKKIEDNDRATELIKLKRQPFYTDIKSSLTDKYALLEASDLIPEISDDFRINETARERWKQRLSAESKDSIFYPKIDIVKRKIEKKNADRSKKVQSDLSISRSIVSRHQNVQKPRKSIMRTESQKIILVAQPNNVKFRNFETRKIYKRAITLKNVSNAVAKFQFEKRPNNSKFSIILESRSGDRENLAPGMSLKLMVVFSSEDADDYEEEIVVKVQFGKSLFVVIGAYRDPPILKGTRICFPSSNNQDSRPEQSIHDIDTCASFQESSEDSWNDLLDDTTFFSGSESDMYVQKNEVTLNPPVSFEHLECKKCFVGEKIVVKTSLKNVGGDGRFFVMSEFDWNSMSIDDITTENTLVLPCFAIWPAYFALKHNEEINFLTYFFPDSRGVQVDKVYIVCDNLSVHPIELIGDGEIYEPRIIQFGNNIERNSGSEESSEECCDYSLNLGFASPNGILKNQITIVNNSGLEIYYRWEKRATDSRETRNRVKTWKDLSLDFLSIRPMEGILLPCSRNNFEVTVELTDLTVDLYRVVLQFIIEDIPIAAVPQEYEELTLNCRKKRRICGTSRDIRVKEIELWSRCTKFPILESFSSNDSFEAIGNSSEWLFENMSLSM